MLNVAPKVGAYIMVRGIRCKIVKVHPFGTIDVKAEGSDKWFRVTGLSF